MRAVEAMLKIAHVCLLCLCVVMSAFRTMATCSLVLIADDGCPWRLWLLMSSYKRS